MSIEKMPKLKKSSIEEWAEYYRQRAKNLQAEVLDLQAKLIQSKADYEKLKELWYDFEFKNTPTNNA